MPDLAARSLTIADDATLCGMIRGAERRVVLMVPATSRPVAEAIGEAWRDLGPDAVTVILDADPEVYRLGFGDPQSLRDLQFDASVQGAMITQQPGVRLGLLIADEQTLVWAPVAQMVEAGPKQIPAANAIRLGLPPADVESDLGAGPDGPTARTLGLEPVGREKIEAVEKNLKDNPPQRFDVCRQMRVFNAFFEFVEIKLTGVQVQRRTVTLPADLLGVTDAPTQERLHAGFHLIEKGDELSGQELMDERQRLEKLYLRRLKGWGWVIQRAYREDFKAEIKDLRKRLDRFKEELTEDLQHHMDASREALHTALLPGVLESPPGRWSTSRLFHRPQDLERYLDEDLREVFGKAERFIDSIKLEVTFKGVTYESLKNDDFMAAARAAFPELETLFEEQDVAPPIPLTQGTA